MKNGILICLVTLVLGCASTGGRKDAELSLKPTVEKTLANGLHVLYIKDTSLPRVGFQLFVQSGSASDPQGQGGLAAVTVSLLEQGTNTRNALKVADDFAQLGSAINDGVSQDYSMVSTSGLSLTQNQLLELFADVVLNPVFAPSEIERKKSQVLSELLQLQDNPQAYADQLLDEVTYFQHPYGHPVMGTISSVKSISRADVLKQYQTHFRPNNAWLAVSGNFDENLPAQVEKLFGQWQKKELEVRKMPSLAQGLDKKIKLFSKPGLQQTQIRIGEVGIARSHPDFLKLRIANIVLGGAFASRLNQRVRDDLGLTYSISSKFETLKEAGSFEISTFSRNEKAGEAIKNTFLVVRDFQRNGITQKELDAAKSLLIGQFPAAIETVDRLAFNLLLLRMNGISDSYLTHFFQNVNGITLAQVNEVIPKYINADHLRTVVFADETKVTDQLSSLSQEAGALTVEKVK